MLQHQFHNRHFQSRSHDKELVLDCQLLILPVIHNHASLHWSSTLTHQLETSLEDQRSRLCHKCGHCESSVNIAAFVSISQKLAFSVCKCQIIEKHHSIFVNPTYIKYARWLTIVLHNLKLNISFTTIHKLLENLF